MVVGVLVALAILTFKSSDFSFKKRGYAVKVHFLNIDGVDRNAPVRLNGMEVGVVKDITIIYGEETKMELTLVIQDHAKIYQGSKAYVKNLGLLGEKYVGLTTGNPSQPQLTAGSIIMGEEAPNFEKILSDGEVIAANLKEISTQINERLKANRENIDEILSRMRIASKNIAGISENLNERLAINKKYIDDIIMNVNTATINLNEMSYDLKLNPWKLMYKERVKKKEGSKE